MADDPEITDPRDPYKRRDVDVVAELDRWLDNSNDRTTPIERRVVLRARHEIVALREIAARPSQELHALIKERDEARDEIVGLRGLLEHSDRTVITAVVVATPAIRDDALEEAAQACVGSGAIVAEARLCASAIRALKGQAR